MTIENNNDGMYNCVYGPIHLLFLCRLVWGTFFRDEVSQSAGLSVITNKCDWGF